MLELDEIFNQFARAFVGTVTSDREIAMPGALDRNALDGSLESLHHVDLYLGVLHLEQSSLLDAELDSTILWGGAYVGEVIRHAAPGFFSWVDYNDYMPQHPDLQPMIPERTTATCAFLVARDGSMSMPLNKIARFIWEGPENSVHFFAKCDLAKLSKPAKKKKSWWGSLPGRRHN